MASRVSATALKTLVALPLFAGFAATAHAAGSVAPVPLTDYIKLPVTNSILTSLLVTTIFLVAVRWAVGKPKIVPGRGQAVLESLITGLREILEPIVGKKAMPAAFPLLLSFFVFILIHNWSGLFPFVGTIGWGHQSAEPLSGMAKFFTGGFHIEAPLFRPHTSEANGTLALSLVSFGAWLILIFKYAGPKLIWHDLFGNKANKAELHPAMYYFLSLVFLGVGVIEIVSIFIRPISLAARLFGNVYGGENLLHDTGFVFVFYFLEIIVGAVQAFVFTLLSAVYIGLICNHGDEHHDEAGHGQAAHSSH
jgi:F-type H+-transporting ATPase subunit a